MNRKIKLIWGFRGSDGFATAQHHCVHLKEFTQIDNSPDEIQLNEMYAIAFITIDEQYIKIFRGVLKPHQGEIVN